VRSDDVEDRITRDFEREPTLVRRSRDLSLRGTYAPEPTCLYYVARRGMVCGEPATHISSWKSADPTFPQLVCCAQHARAIDRNCVTAGEKPTMVPLSEVKP